MPNVQFLQIIGSTMEYVTFPAGRLPPVVVKLNSDSTLILHDGESPALMKK